MPSRRAFLVGGTAAVGGAVGLSALSRGSNASNWTEASTPTESRLRGVAAAGYAVGNDGVFLRRDGGDWTSITDGSLLSASLYGVDAAGDGSVWAVGEASTVLEYDPDADEVTEHDTGLSLGTLQDVGAAGSGPRVYAGTSGGTVLVGERADGSMEWTRVSTGGSDLLGVDAYGPDNVVVSDDDGGVFRTRDGGDTWARLGVPNVDHVLTAVSADADVVHAVGSGARYRRDCPCENWTPGDASVTLRGVDHADGPVAVGDDGIVAERTRTGWQASTVSSQHLRDVAVGSVDLAVGDGGTVLER